MTDYSNNTFQRQKYSQSYRNIPKAMMFLIITVRLIMVFVPLNFEYPDQYWQGPQIAYKIYNSIMDKNYGFQTWEWTMNEPIRNPVYQFILSIGYVMSHYIQQMIYFFRLNPSVNSNQFIDFSIRIKQMFQYSPKIIQALIAIFGDIFFVKTCLFFFRQKINYFNVIFVMSNWYYLSMMSRTFVNSYECALTLAAIYYWLQHLFNNEQFNKISSNDDMKCRALVLLAYVSRPTSLIPWAIFWPYQLRLYILHLYPTLKKEEMKKQKNNKNFYNYLSLIRVSLFVIKNIAHIIIMVISSILVGSFYFGKFTFTDYNFFKINILQGWSHLYGVEPLYYYLLFSLPVILGAYLILFFKGLFLQKQQTEQYLTKQYQKSKLLPNSIPKYQILQQIKTNRLYKHLIVLTFIILGVLSLMGHKQTRFIMVTVPLILIICLQGLQKLNKPNHQAQSHWYLIVILLLIIMTINILLMISIATTGKRGGIQILHTIRNQIAHKRLSNKQEYDNEPISIMYLCAGHSLSAFSTLQTQNIILKIPDSSAQAMLYNKNEEVLLDENPQKLYNILTERIRAQLQNNVTKADYVILQYKYSALNIVDQRFQVNETLNIQIKNQYKFFNEEGYQFVEMRSCRNFWEELIFGYDGFILYRIKDKKI